MNFPTTGRVVIVDDKINEAQIVMESLSKYGIPYSYLQGAKENLPKPEQLIDLRILILDLNLDWEAVAKTGSKEKDFKSKMYALLKHIIKENALYILVIWGKEEDEYYKYVQQLFDDQLKSRRPFKEFSLRKGDYFDLDGNRIDNDKDPIEEIQNKIKEELEKTPSYQLITDWEDCIHIAANETIKLFNELISDKDNYEKEASCLIYSLSRAYLGNQFNNTEREERKLEAALLSLNELFSDSLESTLLTEGSIQAKPELNDWPKNEGYRAIVNEKILISNDVSDKLYPGMTFEEEGPVFKSILNDAINRKEVAAKEFKFDNPDELEGEELKKAEKKALDKFEKKFRKEKIKECVCIDLHVTPLCDYAQNKVRYARLLKGLIIPTGLYQYLNENTEYLYLSEFPFLFHGKPGCLLLDYRYLYSVPRNSLEEKKPLFRIRQQWLVDIQSRLSRHINRPGILYL